MTWDKVAILGFSLKRRGDFVIRRVQPVAYQVQVTTPPGTSISRQGNRSQSGSGGCKRMGACWTRYA